MQDLTFTQPYSGRRRIPFLRRCLVQGAGIDARGIVCNLSSTGVYVAIEPAPPVGQRAYLWLDSPRQQSPIEIHSVVCWDNSDGRAPGLPRGCGMAFLGLAADDHQQIEDIIRDYESRDEQGAAAGPH